MLSKFLLDRLDTFTCAEVLRKFRWKKGVKCPACHARRIGRMRDQNSAFTNAFLLN